MIKERFIEGVGTIAGAFALVATIVWAAFDRVWRKVSYRPRTSIDIECVDPDHPWVSLIGVNDGVSPTYFVEVPREER